MLNLRAEIRTAMATALARGQESGSLRRGDLPAVVLEYPPEGRDGSLGDYASPVALALAKAWGEEPMTVAGAIAGQLVLPPCVERVTVTPPGFLNVHLSPSWLSAKLDNLLREGPSLGRSDLGGGMSVNLEFGSANPTGLPHLGNARVLFVPDVLGNILAHLGYAVTREFYVNDVGKQVARYGESVLRRILQAEGHAVDFPEGLYPGDDVRQIAAAVREIFVEDQGHTFVPADLQDGALQAAVARRAVDVIMKEIRRLLEETAGVRFDVWFSESQLHESGEVTAVLEELERRGYLVERDGARWLTSTAFGDDQDRVLVKSDGERTYLAADLAYHRNKLRRGFQVLADFWGADHHGHIVPLRAGLKALGEDAGRVRVELVQMLRVVQEGKANIPSKRAGTAVPLHEVLGNVGVSATRFFLVMKPLSSIFDFDLDLAVAKSEENPVYYVQYAYVRLMSILRKAKERNLVDPSVSSGDQLARTTLPSTTERRLLALLFRFPEVLEDIARTWEVQRLPQYAVDLARAIHRFYDVVPVLGTAEGELRRVRLVLVLALQAVLGNVLELLGVEKREVM